MIVRMWHGRVPTRKAQAYRAFLNQRAIPDYQSVAGNISPDKLRRSAPANSPKGKKPDKVLPRGRDFWRRFFHQLRNT